MSKAAVYFVSSDDAVISFIIVNKKWLFKDLFLWVLFKNVTPTLALELNEISTVLSYFAIAVAGSWECVLAGLSSSVVQSKNNGWVSTVCMTWALSQHWSTVPMCWEVATLESRKPTQEVTSALLRVWHVRSPQGVQLVWSWTVWFRAWVNMPLQLGKINKPRF